MEYLQHKDFELYCLKLSINQFARFGEPRELSVLEKYRTYGASILADGLSETEKHDLLFQVSEGLSRESRKKA